MYAAEYRGQVVKPTQLPSVTAIASGPVGGFQLLDMPCLINPCFLTMASMSYITLSLLRWHVYCLDPLQYAAYVPFGYSASNIITQRHSHLHWSLLACAGAAANCDMGFDFFSSNVTAGAPCEQCNFPSAWWPASQRQPQGFAAATAVTSAGKSLFKIAVDDTATNPLKLWIRGDNYLLNFNAPIDSTCNPGVPAKTVAAPTRRLKAASNWYVTRTGTYTINWGAGNKPMTNESIATLMEFNAPAGVSNALVIAVRPLSMV